MTDPDAKVPTKQAADGGSVLQYVNVAIEAFRVLAWPLLVLGVLLIYRSPIENSLESLAHKVSDADEISIGSLSFKVEAHAKATGNTELAEKVGKLSRSAVETLLRTPRVGHFEVVRRAGQDGGRQVFSIPSEDELQALAELESHGFLAFAERLDGYRAWITSLSVRPLAADSARPHIVSLAHLSAADLRRIQDQRYELAPAGIVAADAIVRTVAGEIALPD